MRPFVLATSVHTRWPCTDSTIGLLKYGRKLGQPIGKPLQNRQTDWHELGLQNLLDHREIVKKLYPIYNVDMGKNIASAFTLHCFPKQSGHLWHPLDTSSTSARRKYPIVRARRETYMCWLTRSITEVLFLGFKYLDCLSIHWSWL